MPSDSDIVKAVTAKLVGEFCVGQRVRVDDSRLGPSWHGREGFVYVLDANPSAKYSVGIYFGAEVIYFEPRSLKFV